MMIFHKTSSLETCGMGCLLIVLLRISLNVTLKYEITIVFIRTFDMMFDGLFY